MRPSKTSAWHVDKKKYRDTLPAGYQLHWYELEKVIGRGAYGITYLAKDKNLDQLVAVKEYLPTEFASRVEDDTVHPMTGEHEEIYAWGLDRFLREARTLAKFKHSNIVRVLSVFEQNNTAYMVMEYEQGEDLAKLFKKTQSISEQKLLDIFLPVMNGLAEIHREGFIHRDIKPSNIYIRDDGSPVLLDFGSARQTKAENTRALTSLVTYGYAPFEQYNEGEDKQGPWTDIYALGASIYLAVSRKLPADALSRGSSLLNKGIDTYEPLSGFIKEGYSQNFLLAVDNAMQFRAQDRPQNIQSWTGMLTGTHAAPRLQATVANVLPNPEDPTNTLLMPSDHISFRHGKDSLNTDDPFSSGSLQHGSSRPYQMPSDASNRHRQANTEPPVSLAIQGRTQYGAKPGRNLKTVMLTGFAVATIIGLGVVIGLSFITEENPGTATIATKDDASSTNNNAANGNTTVDRQTEKIDQLLTQAETDLKQGRTITPQYNNAAYRYLQVLNIDPDNKTATSKLDKLVNDQVKIIRKNIANKQFDEAQNNTDLLLALVPESKQAIKIKGEVTTSIIAEQKQSKSQINRLLTRADRYFDQHRFLYPKDNNAHDLYRQVLKLDPGNQDARRGIQKIVAYYQDAAEKQIDNQNFSKAKRIINNIATIDASSPIVRGLRNKLAKADRQNTLQVKIDKWLNQARSAFNAKQYSAPAKNNAVYYYRKVLDVDPDNSIARKGMINVENQYKSMVDLAVLKKDRAKIEQVISSVESFAKNSATARYARNALNQLAKAPGKPDIEIISGLIKEYKSHFEAGNVEGLKRISLFRPGRKNFVDQFFSQYQSYEIAVNNFKYIGKEHKGLANISITKLVNNRGNTIQPGAWSQFEIVVSQADNGQWKIKW